jgi:hypothetical protein
MDFTFGIITNGSENLPLIAQSIRAQNIPNYEILVVGQNDLSGSDVRSIPFDESIRPMWLNKKKNIVVQNARYENIVIIHDYIVFMEGWYEGFLRFGSDFSICNSKIIDLHGRRGIDYTLFSPFLAPPCLRDRQLLPYDYPPSHILSTIMYLPGNYTVIKRDIALKFPFDERLVWNQMEDVVLSHTLTDAGHIIKCNPHSTVQMIKSKGIYCDVLLRPEDVEYLDEMPEDHYEHLAHISRIAVQTALFGDKSKTG